MIKCATFELMILSIKLFQMVPIGIALPIVEAVSNTSSYENFSACNLITISQHQRRPNSPVWRQCTNIHGIIALLDSYSSSSILSTTVPIYNCEIIFCEQLVMVVYIVCTTLILHDT